MTNEKSQPITMDEMNQLHDEWWATPHRRSRG